MEYPKANIRKITPAHPEWPNGLQRLPKPPPELWVRGTIDAGPAVAIVGTRRASEQGVQFTRQLSSELSAAGCIVVSGGAFGIDSAAHRGALDAGGRSWAVLPSPVSKPHPRKNWMLFEHIVKSGGALVAEQPPGTEPMRWMFVHRNRLIAALAHVVVVVQAPQGSGALITEKWAKKMGIARFFVPAAPWDPRGTGLMEMAKDGAGVCTSAQDVLSHPALGGSFLSPQKANQAVLLQENISNSKELGSDATLVLELLKAGPQAVDLLIGASGLSAKRVQTALVMLSLAAKVQELPGGVFELR